MSERHTGLELLDAMRKGVNYSKVFSVREGKVRLRILSIDEHEEITNEVAERLMNAPVSARNRVTEETQFAKISLMKASCPDPDSPVPTLTEYVLGKMSVGEMMKLFKDWNKFQEEVDPSMETIPVAQLQDLAEQVKKNPSQLTELSFSELNQLCLYLVAASGDSATAK